jgi:Ca2+/Na+ antiporter
MSIVSVFDIIVLVVLLLCAGDAVLQVKATKEPIRETAFTLVTIGAFGWIAYDVQGLPVQWWAVFLHTGFAIYAVILFKSRNPVGRNGHARTSGRPVRPAT